MESVRCILYLSLLGAASFFLGRILPKSWFRENRFPYRPWAWEKGGTFYHRFYIRKWQAKVPDISRFLPGLIPEKKVTGNFRLQLPTMIRETCVAELIHVLLCLAGFGCIFFWPGVGGIVVSILNILGNIPFIMIQRYNRPRLMALQTRLACKPV